MLAALAQVKNEQERGADGVGGQSGHVHLEVFRMRDMQAAVPFYFP